MEAFVVFISLAGIVMFWMLAAGGELPAQAKDFLFAALPAWLQGVGTVAAAYFAWRAFATWREQDAERRRATAAEELLKATHRAADAIRAARSIYVGLPMELDVKFALGPERMRRVAIMDEFLADLNGHLVVVKHHRYGKEVTGGLLSIVGIGGKVRRAYRMIESVHNGGEDLDDEKREEVLAMFLSVVVEHYGRDEPRNALTDRGDELEQDLKRQVERIEQAVGPVISGI